MVYIVLPAYNEEGNILRLLEGIRWNMNESTPHTSYTIVFVNDGSTDRTREIVESFGVSQSCVADSKFYLSQISHKTNRGLADALKTGLMYCINNGSKRDVVLTMDSDNTHTPGLIFSMLLLIRQGNDVVIASRYQDGSRVVGAPLYRKCLSWIANIMFRILFHIPNVKDYTSGYRAYKLEFLKKAHRSMPNFVSEKGFSCMVDILIKMRVISDKPIMNEVPLILRYDLKKGESKMNVWVTSIQTLNLIRKRLFGRLD